MEEENRSRTHEDDGVSLPEDMIFEVIVRLPVRALCQFRSVSKAWHALISDPSFAAAKRSHACHLIVALFGRRWPGYELRVLDINGEFQIVFEAKESEMLAPTCLDDLICVDRTMRLGAMIIDPAARRAFTVGRDVDVRAYWSHFSFGRANPSGAYKVLRLYEIEIDAVVCEVAMITDDGAEPTWRQRPTADLFTCFSSEQKATVNGVLYFMPYAYATTTPGWSRVAAFDLESEAWMETINGPPLGLEAEPEEWYIGLTDLKGTLCMVQNITNADNVGGLCLVWRLVDYEKSVWIKAYTISMPAEYFLVQVLDVFDDGRIMLLNCCESRYILQFFSPSSEAFTDIMQMPEGFNGTMTFYTRSLLSSKPVSRRCQRDSMVQ